MKKDDILLSLAKSIKQEDLPDQDSRIIASMVGLEAALKIILEFNGVQLYIPKSTEVRLKRLYVERNFDGSNARRLAISLGLAERTVYQWLNQPKTKPAVEQTDLFKPA